MFRRDFSKMLVGAAASVVCAPLAKLLPRKPVNLYVEAAPRFGLALDAEKTERQKAFDALVEIIRTSDAELKAVTGIYKPTLNGPA